MTYEVDAIYNNGAFVPVEPLAIPEGVRVHLRVDEQTATNVAGNMMSRAELDEFLRLAAELPLESPDDGFSGADHDRVLYGEP
jgi:predicted DNA-binding antitoxin AbrB/MazE fold protein